MSDLDCPTVGTLTEERIDRVLTQYRESPKLLFMIRTYLTAVEEMHSNICNLPDLFDIETATGDQLTMIGKRLGWPRCHCICDVQPVFGFEDIAEGFEVYPIAGFCDDSITWSDCDEVGVGDICISDDEMYRKFLKVRRYQMLAYFDSGSLNECLRILFGQAAVVLDQGNGRIVVAPNRDLTNVEVALLQLYPRILPTALGVEVRFHFDSVRVFGFGDGWGGFEEENQALTEETLAFQKTGKVFGFCDDDTYGSFCEPWSDGLPITTEDGEPLLDETGRAIYSDALVADASWMCRISAPWMCEIDVKPYKC